MSQLVGLLSKKGEDVTQRLLELLASPLRHDAYGIATPDGSEHRLYPLDFTSLTGTTALGHRLLKVVPTDNPQPIQDGEKAVALLGRLYDINEPSILKTSDAVRGDAKNGLKKLLKENEGSWAAAIAEKDAIHCARDPIGAVPLFYAQNQELACVSTDTNTLLCLGMTPQRVHPGHIITIQPKGVEDEKITSLENPQQTTLRLEDAVTSLDRLLTQAASRNADIVQPTIAFSGGIDSTLVAYYMKECGVQPRLTCVGGEDSPDIAAAETAADALGLPLRVKTFTVMDLDHELDAILCSVEEANPMKVGVAAPLYFVALDATIKPCRAIFSGNGSDEAFGGYAKYTDEYHTRGEHVRETMFLDVSRSYEVNLERDWKICSNLSLELRLLFIDPQLTRFALSLPLAYKLPKTGREPRKIILRQLAKRLGLPDAVAEKPKKAAQYSSGMGKMLKKLAKKENKITAYYLAERFYEAMRRE